MPFTAQVFWKNVKDRVEGSARSDLARACEAYAGLTTPQQKAQCIRGMMDVLDREVNAETRQAIMEACGRQCIGATIVEKARRLKQGSDGLDGLLCRLNAAHIGGGHLRQEEDGIQAAYDRCYCGSVSKAGAPFSATYCHCSCGWFRAFFEMLLERPVEVRLLGSIIQGDELCRFLIRVQPEK